MAIHHPPTPPARPVVRDHREVSRPVVRQPVVRDHREPVRWDRDRDRDRDRDHDRRRVHIEQPVYQPSVYIQPTSTVWTPGPGYTYVPQPIQLLSPTSLLGEPLTVDVGSLGGATTLELDSAGTGSTYVSQVLLVEGDGDTRSVPVNQVLSAQNPTVQLPIGNSREVTRIVVEGHSDWGGSLALRAV
jgi:hypothetical protein